MTAEICYTTREKVQFILEQAQTAYSSTRIDQCIAAGSRDAEGLLHRVFYPTVGTRYFDIPNGPQLWLNQHEILEVTSVSEDGLALVAGDYVFRPDDGPPYRWIERSSAGTPQGWAGSARQRGVAIEGTFGSSADEVPAGAVAANQDGTSTTLDITDGGAVGVGDLLRIGTERMVVNEKVALTTTQTTNAELAANKSAVTVSVDDGTTFHVGEMILIGAERMYVVDVAANNLIVKRGYAGSVLAVQPSGSLVYAYRRCTVTRAVCGTTGAAHTAAAPVLRNRPPSLVEELSTAYAINNLLQGSGGYARVVGSGDNQRESGGRGVRQIEQDAYRRYGRQGRMRSA
jgi:hypothetical protein